MKEFAGAQVRLGREIGHPSVCVLRRCTHAALTPPLSWRPSCLRGPRVTSGLLGLDGQK